jgi:hypothetical protein
MLCMQGVNLEPMLIKTYGLGPIMMLKFGFVWMGEPVRMPIHVRQLHVLTLCFSRRELGG